MWQEIVIYIIGLLTIGYVGWKVYSFLTRPSDPANPCAGCSGCSLKDEIKKNKKKKTIHPCPEFPAKSPDI